MSPKKPSRKKKLAPITNLAADLEKQAQSEAAKQKQYAPLTDLAEQIRKSVKRAKKKKAAK